MLIHGVIESSTSLWLSGNPIEGKDEPGGFCVDYQGLNHATNRDLSNHHKVHMKRPRSVREVHHSLVVYEYFWRYVQGFANVACPLTQFINKGLSFTK